MVVTGENTASSQILIAEVDSITDARDADITVTNNASFTANGVGGAITIGDDANNVDAFDTLTFNTTGDVVSYKDLTMLIILVNSASS